MILSISACESSPPVQEMSDARQAIAVAKEAGAEELAPMHLQSAEAPDELRERPPNLEDLLERTAERAAGPAAAAMCTLESPDRDSTVCPRDSNQARSASAAWRPVW